MPTNAATRRQFAGLISAALTGWPIGSFARASDRERTVGFLLGLADDDQAKIRTKAFEQGLAGRGWFLGKNLRIEYRYAAGDATLMHRYATQLVELRPDVIVGHSTPVVAQLVRATRTIPIVFVVVADPIGSGFAASIARPGGNVTGFTNLSPTIPGKLLTILEEIAPNLSTVALLFNPDTVAHGELAAEYFHSFHAAASASALQTILAEVRSPAQIEQAMKNIALKSNSGIIVMPDNFTTVHRLQIVSLAAQWRIPSIYPYRYFVDGGGLISYGVDVLDLFRRASDYVDRILRGADPAGLPIQAPTKFELVINLKAAGALNLAVPQVLLAGANALVD
jgi:putative tryptophan/tyrosine transport system substrate-binding protein